MEIILIDTSVWINVFKAIKTKASLFYKNNSGYFVTATCPPIVQEVLQGIVSDADHKLIDQRLSKLTNLEADGYSYARDAANLYRELRKKGVTIRKPNDCLIAIYAIKNNINLLHDDKDFTNIAAFSDLKTVQL